MDIKAILIDDERKALAILSNKLERFCKNIKIIATTQNPKESIQLIESEKPDLIFLDVSMPDLNGFELLKEIEKPDFEVIFVTAFDSYAIEAINYCAIGYLLKPVSNEELVNVVARAIDNIRSKESLKKNQLLVQNLTSVNTCRRIVIPMQSGLEFVSTDEIINCEGEGGYTKVFLSCGSTVLSSHSLGYFSKLLRSFLFIQVHKSHLVNCNHIVKYLNEGYLITTNAKKIPVSRTRKSEFLNMIRRKNEPNRNL